MKRDAAGHRGMPEPAIALTRWCWVDFQAQPEVTELEERLKLYVILPSPSHSGLGLVVDHCEERLNLELLRFDGGTPLLRALRRIDDVVDQNNRGFRDFALDDAAKPRGLSFLPDDKTIDAAVSLR